MKDDPIIRPWHEYVEESHGDRYRIRAKGGLHWCGGNKSAYFSLTGDIDSWNGYLWEDCSGGCIHDDILKHWPELKPLADMHLSDSDGTPMHGAANGWHWLTGAMYEVMPELHGKWGPCTGESYSRKTPAQCRDTLLRHIRIDDTTLSNLVEHLHGVAAGFSHYQRVYERAHVPAVRTAFEAWFETQKPRFKAEAEWVIKAFNLTGYRT